MAGFLLGIPVADFQLHNSLFLVAHFHTMVIGGALFGIFAGINYWFPKFTGFKLNDNIGVYSFWFWLVGVIVSFTPLYILGLMGATRRLDHYDSSMGWQWLFIVAGVGFIIISIGALLQVVQIVVSIIQRKENLDVSGDPWNGRTLEWATSSPPPIYNFAIIPKIIDRDAFWEIKKTQASTLNPTPYQDIEMPKNTAVGIYISAFALAFGFAMIWHIWWLAIVGLVGAIACVIIRSFEEETEYTIPAAEVQRMEEQKINMYSDSFSSYDRN